MKKIFAAAFTCAGFCMSVVSADADATTVSTSRTLFEANQRALHTSPSGGIGTPGLGPGGSDAVVDLLSVDQDPEGDMPRAVAYTPDGAELLVVNRDTDNVMFFDTTSREVLATATVGDFPVDVAVAPDGSVALVANVLSNSVSVIDLSTRTVANTIAVSGTEPFRIRIAGDGSRAVVAMINDAVDSAFSVINLSTMTEESVIASASQGAYGSFFTPEFGIFGNLFTDFAITQNAEQIILPVPSDQAVYVYDRASGSEIAALPVVALGRGIDIAPDDSFAVIQHEGGENSITRIDLDPVPAVGAVYPTPATLSNQLIRVTPDGGSALFSALNEVRFLNLASGVVSAGISTGTVGDIEFSFDDQYAFVSNFNARVIRLASQSLVDTIPFAACVDAAASPTSLQAVALNNRFRENVHFYNINGAAGSLQGSVQSGPAAEGDAPFATAINAAGDTAIVANGVSGNINIVDLPNGLIRATLNVGERTREVGISPDGSTAVICASDANQVVIVDLLSDTIVKTLAINNRPGRVVFTPGGEKAIVLNIAGSDQLSFITLDGADSVITTQLSAGQTGAANGPAYGEWSGIAISPDGSIVVVCDSFNDALRVYDVPGETLLDVVGVGDFPIRATFSPDGSRVYTADHFGDSVSIVLINDTASELENIVFNVSDAPLTIDTNGDGSLVYVGTNDSAGGGALTVIDAVSQTIVNSIPFPDRLPRDTTPPDANGVIGVLHTQGVIDRVQLAGTSGSIIDSTPLASNGGVLAWNGATSRAIVGHPGLDAFSLVRYTPDTCPNDIDGSGEVDFGDIVVLLNAWGPCPKTGGCEADVDADGNVGFQDLVLILNAFGDCP